jgi:hypothetical protein
VIDLLEAIPVMKTVRKSVPGVVLVVLVAFIAGCDDSATPTAPSASEATQAPLAQAREGGVLDGMSATPTDGDVVTPVGPETDAALSAPDGTTLKSTAPTLTSPTNNEVVSSLSPPLTLTNATPLNLPSADFTYRFEVTQLGSTQLIDANTAAQGVTTTSYIVNLALEQGTGYQWRARAEIGGNVGPWSTTATFTTPILLGVPTLASPLDGATVSNFRPDFVVQNGDAPAGSGTVTYQFQIDDEGPTFPNPSEFSATRSSIMQTIGDFGSELAPDTVYHWRVRATDGSVTTDWSLPRSFRTPPINVGPRTPDPLPGQALPPPNESGLIQQLAAAHPGAIGDSCIEEGGSWEFMDLAVEALRKIDTRWGYNCKRGHCNDPSIDVVDYFWGIGDGDRSADVYLIDIISAVCPDGNQSASWGDVTEETHDAGAIGRWIYPRPQ